MEYYLQDTQYIDTSYIGADLVILDIDGVLNNTLTKEPLINGAVHKENLIPFKEMLRQLMCITDAKLVLSSSWRYYYDIEGCKSLVNNRLMLDEIEVIGKTPVYFSNNNNYIKQPISLETIINMPKTYSRGYEAQYVIDLLNPNHYVIIDDFNCFLPSQKSHHIHTLTHVGFTEEHIKDVINLFR